MLGARTITKPRYEKNFADRDDFTCIGRVRYAIIRPYQKIGVAFFPDPTLPPSPCEGGCLAARKQETETELQVVARGQLAPLPKLRIPRLFSVSY